jgi:hypothetical protein
MDSGKDCLHAWELMPWVLQGSATDEQSRWLTGHLEQCESCRAEYAQQKRLKQALSLPPVVAPDPEAGLRRLLGRLDAPEAQAAPSHRPRAGRWLARALVAAVLVQAVGIGMLSMKLWSAGDGKPAYRTLSEAAAPVPPGAIHVIPDASMALADWNSLLRNLGLQVVGGPNDVGAYTVVPANAGATPARALQQLRASRRIRLAEPAGSP